MTGILSGHINPEDIDGFEVFGTLDGLRYHEAKVIHEDNRRFDAFMDSVSDHPEVQAWLASLDESAA